MSFTPGPWVADLAHAIVTANGGRTLVCDCRAPTMPLGECYQAAEDARFIAVAPDLLAACEALLAQTARWQHDPECSPAGAAAVTLARAAIARTRGSEEGRA